MWRGNIRELRNVLEQAAMRSDTQHIDAPELEQVLRESGVTQIAPAVAPAPVAASKPEARALRPLAEQVAELEREAIEAALAVTLGNKVAAARLLGISRAKLYERLEPVSENQADV
jgi:DNA-binding NtrC family response regulator